MREPAHEFGVVAHCRVRWRGNSFDAYDAEARLGLALAEAMGVDARDKRALDAFADGVRITRSRSSADQNPESTFDPNEGEWWEFRVAILDAVDAAVVERAKEAAVHAVNAARNFEGARVA